MFTLLPPCCPAAEFAASLVDKCRGVDLAAVAAAVSEAAQTASFLESAVASLHATPQSGKGSRGVPHSRSSPDFNREERLSAKQRLGAAAADPHRHHSEDGLGPGRHYGVPGGDPGAHREWPG